MKTVISPIKTTFKTLTRMKPQTVFNTQAAIKAALTRVGVTPPEEKIEIEVCEFSGKFAHLNAKVKIYRQEMRWVGQNQNSYDVALPIIGIDQKIQIHIL